MKIVYISPHLSTGGCPQYLLKKIKVLNDRHDVYCIEYSNVGVFTVQRNQIQEILKNKFFSLSENKMVVLDIIEKINPDIVHLEEMPEYFMDGDVAIKLYSKSRKYKLIETSHDSSFNPSNKGFFPDRIIFVSEYQRKTLRSLDIPMDVCEYPITIKARKPREEALKVLGLDPNKKHVVNVGLFTPRKNQAEIIEYAKQMVDQPVQFHFIGNQADNFKHYWEPLMKDFPLNCTWWNERKDVDNFYQAADLFLFTSRGTNNDKETSPLVIREAISYNIPSLIYNLPVYLGMYDKYDNIKYLDWEKDNNINKILKMLNIESNDGMFFTLSGKQNLASYDYPNSMYETMIKYGDAAAMYWGTFLFNELERFDVKVQEGDVFVDLGANIGMSSKYAVKKGAKEIHAFEPDPALAEILQKNVPAAKIYRNAIDKDVKEIELYHWPYNPENKGPKYKTTTLRLRDVIKLIGKPIDYLKMDIEGFEEHVFDDLSSSDCRQIKKMFIEHHHPSRTSEFCSKLRSRGFNVNMEAGNGQNYIYATQTNVSLKGMPFNARWDWNDQRVYYSCAQQIDFPILVSLKEYKSDAVLWATEYDSFPANCEFWMLPTPKNSCDYSKYEFLSGIKFCIYRKDTQEQLYEAPFFNKFVNMPTISLSNQVPYYINYLEYFIQGKYSNWFDKSKQFHTVVDVGANIGIFTEFLIRNKLAKKIHAIECDKVALNDLQRNYDLNDNVKVVGKALSYNNDPIIFYHCPENSVISSTVPPDKVAHHRAGILGSQQTKVETITIKDLVQELGHINLLKIDIEGAEYKVIENLDPSLCEHIDNFFIECHFFESDYKEKYTKLVEKVKSMGYKVESDVVKPVEEYAGASECIFATKE